MPEYPSGTVGFLFTDIEGSTRRWETHQAAMRETVERHFALLRSAIEAHQGVLFKTIGDAAQAAFPSIPAAVAAASAAQTALGAEDWGQLGPLRVRMAIHAGEATPQNGDYLAPALNRLSRLLSAGYGEQILLTETASKLATALPPGHGLMDLGRHRLRDLLEPERIYQLTGPGLPSDFPPLKTLDLQLNNLPAQPTALIGRESELALLRESIAAPGARLVTLTGTGGTGKTRLALQAAAESLETFPDGVWWVPLASITDSRLVVDAIAAALAVREVPGEELLATLSEHLRSRRTLLLLDNVEHVIESAPLLARLLDAAPQLVILATSREPLRLRAEREFPLDPLPLPNARGDLTVQAAQVSPAVQLFVERAQAVKPGFTLDQDNVADVVAICRRLDGLPLAIELAAARVRILSPATLLSRLDRRLAVLTGGARDLPVRQQTLRAAIEWSHDLLLPAEQSLFSRLAIFAGECTLEAAEAVCTVATGADIDILDGLESLTQKSLLRQVDGGDGSPRFMMLESIREYGLERLNTMGDAVLVHDAYADFYLRFSEEAESWLTSPDQARWLNRLAADHDNLRAALDWMKKRGRGEERLRMASSLWRFWWMRGHLSEGREWLERALTDVHGVSAAVHADALSGAGVLAETQGDYKQAVELHQTALALRRQIDDRAGIASSLTNLGIIAGVRGEFERAHELHTEAFGLWRDLGDEGGAAGSLNELGAIALNRGAYSEAADQLQQALELGRKMGDVVVVGAVLESLGILAFYQGHYEEATTLYEQSLAVWRNLDDSRMIAQLLVSIGEVALYQGDLDDAEVSYEEALPLFQELGDKQGAASAIRQLGKVALARKEVVRATALFSESLALSEMAGDTSALIESIESLGEAETTQSNPARGVRLLAAANALRQAFGMSLPASYGAQLRRHLEAARAVLGEAMFGAEWERGHSLTLRQAIAEAIATTQPAAGRLLSVDGNSESQETTPSQRQTSP